MDKLRRRPEFLAVAGTRRRWNAPGLVLQLRRREDGSNAPHLPQGDTGIPGADLAPVRYGLTASRKVGGAVERNRAKRRLRALAGEIFSDHVVAGVDLVIVARTETVTRPFADLRTDLITALRRLGVWQEAEGGHGTGLLAPGGKRESG